MKNLHKIQGLLPDYVKYLAIGWAKWGWANLYQLMYNPDTDEVMYKWSTQPRRFFPDPANSEYVRSGKKLGLQKFDPHTVIITYLLPTHNKD